MPTSYFFGHKIWWDSVESKWRYNDTNEFTDDAKPRKCPKCKEFETKDGQDPCIANLKGVAAACCGHGVKGEQPYILFDDMVTVVRFDDIKRLNNFMLHKQYKIIQNL